MEQPKREMEGYVRKLNERETLCPRWGKVKLGSNDDQHGNAMRTEKKKK